MKDTEAQSSTKIVSALCVRHRFGVAAKCLCMMILVLKTDVTTVNPILIFVPISANANRQRWGPCWSGWAGSTRTTRCGRCSPSRTGTAIAGAAPSRRATRTSWAAACSTAPTTTRSPPRPPCWTASLPDMTGAGFSSWVSLLLSGWQTE